jgi:hypothetical protein
MTKAITPEESATDAWIAHGTAEAAASIAGDTDLSALLQARRAVAREKPGCARAILSPDAASNWDRGALIQEAKRRILNA